MGACNPVCSSALARLGASASRACVGCQDTQTDLFLFPGNNPKSSSKSPGEADGQGLREVLEFAATVFLSVGLGLGWGTAGICSARPTRHCAFCFPSIQLSVKMEKGTVPGMLGMGLQPSVSSRGCSWDAPESQRCLCIVDQEPGQWNLRACRHVRLGVRPLLGPRPLDPGQVHARASGSLRAHPGS